MTNIIQKVNIKNKYSGKFKVPKPVVFFVTGMINVT